MANVKNLVSKKQSLCDHVKYAQREIKPLQIQSERPARNKLFPPATCLQICTPKFYAMQVDSECFQIMLLEGTKNINMKTLFMTFLTVKIGFERDKGKVSQHLPVGHLSCLFQSLCEGILGQI